MKVAVYRYGEEGLDQFIDPDHVDETKCQLLLGFGSKNMLLNQSVFDSLKKKFPDSIIALSSTAGEIFMEHVTENTLSVTAIQFENTIVKSEVVNVSSFKSSFEAGAGLIKKLPLKDLKHIFILSDGALVNGSQLINGMNSITKNEIPITGGLAGDSANFQSTLVGLDKMPENGNIIAIGFYGNSIVINYGSNGGWIGFGLEKKITKSSANELYEIDRINALELYKNYLGKYAKSLPASALLFPLSIKVKEEDEPIVRTILSINEERRSMIFAGDVPEGAKVRFMKANLDNLAEAAGTATKKLIERAGNNKPKLVVLISCVGRKLIFGKRIEEEISAVNDMLSEHTLITGFYSYGEISPSNRNACCELHNQTMTITSFDER